MNSLLTRITTIICFLATFFGHAQHEFTEELKGSVRLILEESFEGIKKDSIILKNGKNHQFSWIQDNEMEFDKNSHLIKRSFFDNERNHVRTESFVYKDNVISKKTIQGFTFLYRHNEKGLITEEILISKTDTSDVRLKHRYKYNEQDQVSDIWEFDMHGGHVCHQRNKYALNGKIQKETIKYDDGVEYKNYMYGADGKLNKVEWFDFQSGLLERKTISYSNGKKHFEFWEVFERGRVESTITYEFDLNGNPISILEINERRKIHDHEVNSYVYDDSNNWIKKTTAINENRYFIVERRIRYYI